jgi:LAO/AO transport system kinase
MEMADAIVINKADGDNLLKAKTARVEYQNALHLFPPTESDWQPEVEIMSARLKQGIDRVWNLISDYQTLVKENGFFELNRRHQMKRIMHETIEQMLLDHFYRQDGIKQLIQQTENDLEASKLSSYQAAHKVLNHYFSNPKN